MSMRSLIGRTLGNYRLVEQIGMGGMAIIFKAYDPDLDRYVALKLLPEYLSHDGTFSDRFRREARNVARLRHPNILPIYGYGEEDGLSYFVMELIEGGTVKDLLGRPMKVERAAGLIVQIAGALQYAHEQGIVHRDVKPANILMARPDWALLSDFGIARVLEQGAALTHSAFLGTPHYMAPEQARGEEITPRTDQYALGIVLYEMLTGTPPYQADTPQAVVYQHIYASVPPPRQQNPDIPGRMERIIMTALAKDPRNRFHDMNALAEAVRAAAGGTDAVPRLSSVRADSTQEVSPEIANQLRGTVLPESIAPPESTTSGVRTSGTSDVPATGIATPVALPENYRSRSGITRPRWLLIAIPGIGLLFIALLTIYHLTGSTAMTVKVTVIAPSSASLPALSIIDAKTRSILTIQSAGTKAQMSLQPGHYELRFPSASRYRMTVPFAVGSHEEILRLAARCSLFRVVPVGGSTPSLVVQSPAGAHITDLTPQDVERGVWLLTSHYKFMFTGGGYTGVLPVVVKGQTVLDLNTRMSFVRIIPPPQGILPTITIRDAVSHQSFGPVSPVQAQQGSYIPAGNLSLDLSKGDYLDPLILTAPAGQRQVIRLGTVYAGLRIPPLGGNELLSFSWLSKVGHVPHKVDATSHVQTVYVLPGTYKIEASSGGGSTTSTVRAIAGQTIQLYPG